MSSEHGAVLVRTCAAPRLGLLPIVWVGIAAVGVPAVRRHQRDLLLLQRSSGRRSASPRTTRADHASSQPIINIVGHVHRHRRSSTGSAASRCCSSARSAWSVSLGTRWPGSFATATTDVAGNPVLAGAAAPTVALIAANVLRVLVRAVLGPGGLGAARRDVPEPDPRRRAVGGRGRSVGGELGRSPSASRRSPAAPSALAYGIYATFALLSFFFVIAKVRETKGRTLEELSAPAP